tara:strand:+ start:74 stop:703 length:630 start_codon:yes stop_codon:yes gene_type:complete
MKTKSNRINPTVPTTDYTLGRLHDLRKAGVEGALEATIEAQKGFGPTWKEWDRMNMAASQALPLLAKHDDYRNLLSDNSGFKKGDTAYKIEVWSRDETTKMVTVSITRLTIQSFGKKEGTAIREQDGKLLKRLIYPTITILAHTLADAHTMAAEVGIYESDHDISLSLPRDKAWLAKYEGTSRPEIVAKVRGRVAYLETATPRFEVLER